MDHIDQTSPCEPPIQVHSAIFEHERQRLAERQQAFRASFGVRRWSEEPAVAPEGQECEIEAPGDASEEGPAYRREVPSERSPEALLLSIQESKSQQTGTEGLTSGIPGDQAEKLSRRLVRYGRAVDALPELVDYLRSVELEHVGQVRTSDRADRLNACGTWLEFRHFFTLPDQAVKLSAGNFCQQHLMCGLCAIRRASKMLRTYVPKILTAIKPGMYAYLVTFTQPSGPDLRTQWKQLDKYLRKFWINAKSSRNGRGRFRVSSLINGAVFSVEAKRGEGTRGGGWHVHAHGLVLSDRELSAAAIAAEWSEVTDGLANVDAQDVRPLHSMALFDSEDVTELQLLESAGGDLVEVFKYPLKFSSLVPADRWEAFKVFSGRRLIRPLGSLYHLEADAKFLEEPLQLQDLPYVRLIFRYLEKRYALDQRIFVDGITKP